METENKEVRKPHQGENVSRLRRAMGMKQEALAIKLNTTQQVISLIEKKRELENDMLLKVAEALKVSPEVIRELEADPASLVVENNTFESGSIGNIANNQTNENENFGNTYHNPIEEVLKLNNEKIALYERLLEVEKKNASVLEQLLKEKNA